MIRASPSPFWGSAPEGWPAGVPDGGTGASVGVGGASGAAAQQGTGRRLTPLLIGGGAAVAAVVGAVIFFGSGDDGVDPRDRLFETLTDLSRSQGTFLTANGAYSRDANELGVSPDPDLTVDIQAATPLGWSATASLTGYQEVCSIFIGDATPPPNQARISRAGLR